MRQTSCGLRNELKIILLDLNNSRTEDDDLPVPAGSFRVVLGLILMTLGSFTGLLAVRRWLSLLGWAVFIVSF